jgi:protein-L-isoaspartate(D-aspartate) O-methyltransferase
VEKSVTARTEGYDYLREVMMKRQIVARGVRSPQVLAAMKKVRREGYVPSYLGEFAYDDTPLPIEEEQTISQPCIVALMKKGCAAPVQVSEVTGAGSARTRFRASARRGLTHFVGRQAELDQLRRAQQLAGHLGLGKLYRRTGDLAKTLEHLSVATALYREMDMGFWLEQADAELGGVER